MKIEEIDKEECLFVGKRLGVKRKRVIENLKNWLADKEVELQNENDVRKFLLPFVESQINDWIMYDGNTIYRVDQLVREFEKLIADYKFENFTDYLYKFFSLQCGSIAHYSKDGWFDVYDTKEKLKAFFEKNEFGRAVKDYSPYWHYDGRLAQEKMSKLILEE